MFIHIHIYIDIFTVKRPMNSCCIGSVCFFSVFHVFFFPALLFKVFLFFLISILFSSRRALMVLSACLSITFSSFIVCKMDKRRKQGGLWMLVFSSHIFLQGRNSKKGK